MIACFDRLFSSTMWSLLNDWDIAATDGFYTMVFIFIFPQPPVTVLCNDNRPGVVGEHLRCRDKITLCSIHWLMCGGTEGSTWKM